RWHWATASPSLPPPERNFRSGPACHSRLTAGSCPAGSVLPARLSAPGRSAGGATTDERRPSGGGRGAGGGGLAGPARALAERRPADAAALVAKVATTPLALLRLSAFPPGNHVRLGPRARRGRPHPVPGMVSPHGSLGEVTSGPCVA